MAETPSIDIDHLIDVATGAAVENPEDRENRTLRRMDHEAPLALVQRTPTGGMSIPTVVMSSNMSAGGMCIISRYMLHVGYEGAILMQRHDGSEVLIGIKVVHCKYVGEMAHESGLEFTGQAEGFTLDDFRDEQGHMPDLMRRAA